jgi:ribosome-binding factor A
LAALDKATGFMRKELANRLNLRTVPQLHFHWDATLAHAQRISEVLDNLDIPPDIDEDDTVKA